MQAVQTLQRQLSEAQEEAEDLRAQIIDYRRISNEKDDAFRAQQHESQLLRKQIQEMQVVKEEAEQLSQTISTKNTEVAQLKQTLYDTQNLRHEKQMLAQQNEFLQ